MTKMTHRSYPVSIQSGMQSLNVALGAKILPGVHVADALSASLLNIDVLEPAESTSRENVTIEMVFENGSVESQHIEQFIGRADVAGVASLLVFEGARSNA